MGPAAKQVVRAAGFPCALCALLALALIGCGSSAPVTPARRYHLEGTVVAVRKEQRQLVVDNKDIPGFMSAMTMSYPVADADTAALDALAPGDRITADIVINSDGYRLENIVRVKKSTGPPPAPPGQASLPARGDRVRYRNERSAFVSTNLDCCPLPSSSPPCPLLTAGLP